MDGEITYRYDHNESVFEFTLPLVAVTQPQASPSSDERMAAAPTTWAHPLGRVLLAESLPQIQPFRVVA